MPFLTHDEIVKLSEAARNAGLVASRDALLSGIDEGEKSRIPRRERPDAQVFADLDHLNQVSDGSVPILKWLKNAEHLVGPRVERKIFTRFRKRVEQRVRPRAPTPPRQPRVTNGTGGVDAPVPNAADPEQAEWLNGMREWRRWPRLWLGIGLVVVVLLLVGTKGRSDVARFGCDVVQLACVCYFFAHAISTQPRDLKLVKSDWVDDERQQCADCVYQFMRRWWRLWAIWIGFYFLHCLRHGLEFSGADQALWLKPWWGPVCICVLSALHLAQSGTFVILFWTMIRPILPKSRREVDRVTLFVRTTVYALSGVNLAVLLWTKEDPAPAFVSTVVIGTVVAAAMGLFTGRLESRYFRVGFVELWLLYLYTAIQPLFRITVWMEHSNIGLLDPSHYTVTEALLRVKDFKSIAIGTDLGFKLLALVLKLGLYTVVYRQIKSGRLAFYMWKVRVRHTEGKRDWEAFERDKLEPTEQPAGTSTSRRPEQEPPRADERKAG